MLAGARVAHLGLLDGEGRPRVLPVTFAQAEGSLWTAVDHKPKRREGEELARVRWVRRRPEAALTVDAYDDDWSHLAWVQALGSVEILEADAGAPGLDALRAKYPQYRERPPAGPFLRLVPRRFLAWRA